MAGKVGEVRERNRIYQREYRKRFAEKVKDQNRLYAKANREKINARNRESYAKDPAKFKAISRAKYRNSSEAEKARTRAYRKKNPEKALTYARRSTLRRRYGMEETDFLEMLRLQNNRCAVCTAEFSGLRNAAVDHCHRSNKIRALLCVRCNTALGMFKDDPAVMRAAAAYVESHQCETP